MKCYKCASIVNVKATFCSNCGYKIGSKEMEEDFKYLSEKERNELLFMDDPNVKYSSPSGGIWLVIFGSKSSKHSKKRVVELRTKMRMEKLGFNKRDNAKEYKAIKEEEEKRFNERFK